ncbi:MAG TPA: acyl-CoA reductase, partial [Chitinophagaceae bacterium]
MSLIQRLDTLARLRMYMLGKDPQWEAAKQKAYQHNGWFIPLFIDLAVEHITSFLEPTRLQQWLSNYLIPDEQPAPKTIGLVLPGNIPMAGFYDFMCVYISGHRQRIKLSPKDEVLIKHLVQHPMKTFDPKGAAAISFEDMLKGCDAYIATDAGTLSQYLGKYPCILRSPAKRAAILTGDEPIAQLEQLADDVFQYFGHGHLNVSKLYVPRDFDFIPLLRAFEKYRFLADHNKYGNNYDYQLALLILNKEFYMTNGCILLTEGGSGPSPTARLHYEYYDDPQAVLNKSTSLVAGNSLA